MKLNMWEELKKVLKIAKKEFILKFISALLLRGSLLLIPIFFSDAINYATKANYDKAYTYIGISIGIIVFYRLLESINQGTLYILYNKLYTHYHSLGLQKTNENSMFSLSRFNLGQYTNLLTTDVDIISGFFANLVVRVIQLLEFIIIYAYFLSLDKLICIVAILISIIILVLIPGANRKVEKININKKSEYDKMIMVIHEFFKNIKEIKCFNLFDEVFPEAIKQNKKYLKENRKYFVTYTANNQLFLIVFEVFRLLSVGYGIYLITQGNMEIGSLLIIYNYYQKIIDNYGTILTMSVEYTNLKVSFERFNHLVEYSTPKLNKKDDKTNITDGRIVFDNILYGYKTDPTLNHVSFEIEPNNLTIITGKPGTGISGVFDLLLKLNRQHEGIITIDGTDIKEIDDAEYFSSICLVSQTSTLFPVSILTNLMFLDKDENNIKKICKELKIDDEINNLKDGYNTVVQEENISPTLKRLILIARALISDSKIILFDESFLGLEDDKKEIILKMILELKNNHTIVVSSRDPLILNNADKIITIE